MGDFLNVCILTIKGGSKMDDIYTALEDVKSLLNERENEDSFKEKLSDWVGEFDIPDQVKIFHEEKKVVAIIARHVPTFRNEDDVFIEMVKNIGLEPWWLAYYDDKFTTRNADKNNLWKMPIKYKNGLRYLKIVDDIGKWENKPLSQMETIFTTSLIEEHMSIRKHYIPAIYKNIFDCSKWLQSIGDSKKYYKYYLSLFVGKMVLFEDFHPYDEKKKNAQSNQNFRDQVVIPAIYEIEKFFGIKPMIVRIPWDKGNNLSYYPEDIEEIIKKEKLVYS